MERKADRRRPSEARQVAGAPERGEVGKAGTERRLCGVVAEGK